MSEEIKTAREEIQKIIDELTPDYVGANYLRSIEDMLESVVAECGPHPLLVAAIENISRRICALEIGVNTVQKGDKTMAGMKIAGEPTIQASFAQHVGRLLERVLPSVVVAGIADVPKDGRPARRFAGVDADAELLGKTKHVRRPKETMMQFFSRVGLGASQIRAMGEDEIARFVDVVSSQETAAEPPMMYEAKPVPQRFLLV